MTAPACRDRDPARSARARCCARGLALIALDSGGRLPDALPRLTPADRRELELQIEQRAAHLAALTAQGKLATLEAIQTKLRIDTDRGRLAAYASDGSPRQLAMGALERAAPKDSELLVRGEIEKPGEVVARGLPRLAGATTTVARGSGRRELAAWIASPENPLTARVIVNRVWLHHFGRGIVVTPDNFGLAGEKPSHPQLLDHLAARFVAQGWSLKRLIRELALSRVYALSTAHDAGCFDVDPDNALRWRMSPRRLDAEVIRDSLLLAAGRLDLEPTPGSQIATHGDGYVSLYLLRLRGPLDQRLDCRSVYLPAIRGMPMESLALFDMTAGSVVTGQRPQTIVPAQSLYLLNGPGIVALAQSAAQRLLREIPADDRARVQLAYERFFARRASDAEVQLALAHVRGAASPQAGWTSLCQAMWASHEFLARG